MVVFMWALKKIRFNVYLTLQGLRIMMLDQVLVNLRQNIGKELMISAAISKNTDERSLGYGNKANFVRFP